MLSTVQTQNAKLLLLAHLRVQGGKGSGNFGHGGRKGEKGGSESGSGEASHWTESKEASKLSAKEKEFQGTEGECYRNVNRWNARYGENTDLVVHGEVTNVEGKTFGHAWIERGNIVIDPTTHVTMLKEKFYSALHAKPEGKYKSTEAIRNQITARHHGPWTAADLRSAGGKGSGNFHHEGRPGEKGGSGSGSDAKVRNERSLRALKAFIPVTKEGQRRAEAMEHHVARLAGGRIVEGTVNPRTGKLQRNAPVDVVTQHGGRKQGIEVKTLLNQTNDKLTVRKNAAEKKTLWGRSNHASVHIVAVDARPGKSNQIYYRKGHGSFRLHSMTKVKNGNHLRKLLGA